MLKPIFVMHHFITINQGLTTHSGHTSHTINGLDENANVAAIFIPVCSAGCCVFSVHTGSDAGYWRE